MNNIVFSKKRMMARLESLGLSGLVGADVIKVMDSIDGLPVYTGPTWISTVYGDDLFLCKSNNGANIPVYPKDCITLEEWKKENCS